MSATPDIVMYSTGWCPYCERARTLLERKGAAFREIKALDLGPDGSLYAAAIDGQTAETARPATPSAAQVDLQELVPQRYAPQALVVIEQTPAPLQVPAVLSTPEEQVAKIDAAQLDADEKTALWSLFDSKQRAAMKAVKK